MKTNRNKWKALLIVILVFISGCKANQKEKNETPDHIEDVQDPEKIAFEINEEEIPENYSIISDKRPLISGFDLSPYGNAMDDLIVYYLAQSPIAKTPAFNVDPESAPIYEDEFVMEADHEINKDIEKILRAYESLRFQEDSLYGSTAGYVAAQLAIWGKLLETDPLSLIELGDAEPELSSKIKDLSSYLYNYDAPYLASDFKHSYRIFYNDAPITKNIEASESGMSLYIDGVKYFRSEKIDVEYTNAYNCREVIAVENGYVSEYGSNERNKEIVLDSGKEAEFYIWTPCYSQRETTVTISGEYYYPEVVYWSNTRNDSESKGPDLMSLIYKKILYDQKVVFYHDGISEGQSHGSTDWD